MLLTGVRSSTGAGARARARARGEGKSEGFTEFLDSNRLRLLFGNIEDLDEVSTGNQRSTGGVATKKASGSKEDFNDRSVIKSGHDMGV